MSARINGITNTNNDVVIENNMKELPLVREEYYLTRESFNKFIANDISFGSNISISGDLIPLNSVTSDLGSSTKYWSNAYIRDVSVSNMSISGNINVSENINITENINISGNINVSENINISGNLLSLSNTSQIGSSENYWSNAYIRDVSINNISISGNNSVGGNISISGNNSVGGNISISGDIIPLNNAISDLGSNEKYWRNAYIRDLSVTNISVSGSITIPNGSIVTNDISNLNITHEKIANNAIQTHNIDASAVINSKIAYGTITSDKINSSGTWSFTNISISGDLIPLNSVASDLGSSANYWSNAYIHDISASNISVSGNINVGENISISGDLEPLYSVMSDLGSSTKYWRNAYIDNIDISSHIRIGNGHFGGKITATTTPHELIIDPYSFENSPYTGTDASGRVVILGDLIIRGDTTTITSNIVDISDLTLNIASNATKNTVFGIESGITLGNDSYASLLYNRVSDSWITNIGIEISGSMNINENITLSGNLISSSTTSQLGSSANYWNNAYISNLNVTNFVNTIDASYLTDNTITSAKIANGTIVDTDISNNASIAFSKINASLAIMDTDISSNAAISGSKLATASIASSKIDSSGTWTFTNISGTHMSISGNLIPLTATNSSTLGSNANYWRNAYITDLSVNNTISISGNLEPLNTNNTSSLGNIGKLWSNAYIRDLSIANITISGNILPLDNSSSDLGSSLKRWRNIYVNDLSVSTINGEAYGGPIDLTSVSGNIIPSLNNTFRLGDVSRNWSNAYITNISATNISVSGNLTTDISNFRITSTHRMYQNISGDISWNAVNGYYGLAKDAYPALDPYSSGVKAVSNWTGRSQGVDTNFWESVCWSPERGIFVAVATIGNNNRVMTSYDGISWTGISQGVDTNYWCSVCWSPKLEIFVAVANGGDTNNRVMTSDTGTAWTSISGGVELNSWRSVCWSPELGIFVVVSQDGNNRVMTSSNGTSWTSISGGVELNNWRSVCWSPELGIFVAVATGGDTNNRVMTSPNGRSWRPTSQGVDANAWISVCWSPQLGLFVAVASSGTTNNRVMTSSNGISWTGTSQGVLLNAWFSICWSPQLGIFVAVSPFGDNNKAMTSPNGINWTSISQGVADSSWDSICWSPELGIFVAVALFGTNLVMTSSLKGRPPTSYNVFDSSFNSIDENGNWTFSNISVSGNLEPLNNNTSNLGLSNTRWNNLYINNIDVSGDISNVRSIIPQIANDISSSLGTIQNTWQKAFISDLSGITKINGISWPLNSGSSDFSGTDISTSLIPRNPTSIDLGSTTNYWRNAYITDLSVANITISGNMLPLLDISSDLGSSLKRWRNIYVNDLSVSRINGQAYSAATAIDLTSVSGNIIPSLNNTFRLGDVSRNWSNAYITNISATNISVSGNIIFSISGGSIRIAADASTNSITTTSRIYQNISGGINDPSWTSVNGYYGLTKDAYPSLNPSSSGVKAVEKWISRVSQIATWWSVCWSPELQKFAAVGNSGSMTSSDGITWYSSSQGGGVFVCWSPGLRIFVSVNQSFIATSPDGITWTQRSNINNYWVGVCWSPELGLLVAVARDGTNKVATSPDGITWSEKTSAGESNGWRSVCWSPELRIFVAVATAGNNRVMTSPDGTSWTARLSALETASWFSVCWSPQLGLFVVVSSSGSRVMTSPDGINWTIISIPSNAWRSVCWSPELKLFVAVAEGGTNRVMTSPDGKSWTARLSALETALWSGVCWSPELGLFVAVAWSGVPFRVMTSSLKGRPPTSYNVFDSSFNSIDESGNWTFSNITISGNMLSQNNTSQVPVSYSTFSVVSAQNRNLPSYIDTLSPNVWIPASAYDISKVVLSNRSVIKIEVKVNYTASPEADQTLSFRVLESSNNGVTYITTPVFSDISLGSSMGVTINNIYNGSYYDDLSGITLSGNIITYRLEFRRDCPSGNTIKTGYGIQASTGNYISLQELYKPP